VKLRPFGSTSGDENVNIILAMADEDQVTASEERKGGYWSGRLGAKSSLQSPVPPPGPFPDPPIAFDDSPRTSRKRAQPWAKLFAVVCVAVALGTTTAVAQFFLFGVSVPVSASQLQNKSHGLNPSACPGPTVLASTLGIQVTQVSSHVEHGPSTDNTCNYLTGSVLRNGQPSWQSFVSFNWPTSGGMFAAERHFSGLGPAVNVSHLGTSAFALKDWQQIWVLSGDVQINISLGQLHPTQQQVLALARKIL
jgi:hypothetical protein